MVSMWTIGRQTSWAADVWCEKNQLRIQWWLTVVKVLQVVCWWEEEGEKAWDKRNVFSLDLKTATESRTVFTKEFDLCVCCLTFCTVLTRPWQNSPLVLVTFQTCMIPSQCVVTLLLVLGLHQLRLWTKSSHLSQLKVDTGSLYDMSKKLISSDKSIYRPVVEFWLLHIYPLLFVCML